jgi:hypothetical protein
MQPSITEILIIKSKEREVIMKTIKKCVMWYIRAFGEAYDTEKAYRYYRLY